MYRAIFIFACLFGERKSVLKRRVPGDHLLYDVSRAIADGLHGGQEESGQACQVSRQAQPHHGSPEPRVSQRRSVTMKVWQHMEAVGQQTNILEAVGLLPEDSLQGGVQRRGDRVLLMPGLHRVSRENFVSLEAKGIYKKLKRKKIFIILIS